MLRILGRGKKQNRPQSRTTNPEQGPKQGTAQRSQKRLLSISLGQAVIATSILCGTLILVFFFSFHAGREQGLEAALNGQSEQIVRLPVTQRPLAESDSDELGIVGAHLPADSFISPEDTGRAKLSDNVSTVAGAEPNFDFNGLDVGEPDSAKPTAGAELEESQEPREQQQVAGIAAKPTVAVIKNSSAPATTSQQLARLDVPQTRQATTNSNTKLKQTKLEKTIAPEKPVAKQLPQNTKPQSSTEIDYSNSLAAGWYVQVIAANSKREADEIGRKLQRSGTGVKIQSAEVNSKVYHRVLVGPYNSRDQAQRKQRDIKALSLTNNSPFLKRVS